MNIICITGRITQNIELKVTQSGVSVCSFQLAVKRPNAKDTTDFINCVAWRKTAEFISQYFGKGKKAEIVGILTTRKYEDQKGNSRVIYEVVVEKVDFAEGKNAEDEGEEGTTGEYPITIDESDLPF